MNTYTSNNDPYDQYEVSVPIEIVGDCMAKVEALTLHLHNHASCIRAQPSSCTCTVVEWLQS